MASKLALLAGAAGVGLSSHFSRRHNINDGKLDYEILGENYFSAADEPWVDAGCTAVEIEAPADEVWARIKQMGQNKAGFYSFEGVQRLLTLDVRNHYEIHPEWQTLNPGDFIYMHQPPHGYGLEVLAIDDEKRQMTALSDSRRHAFAEGGKFLKPVGLSHFAFTWSFSVIELDEGRSKLVTKMKLSCAPFNAVTKLAMVPLMSGHDLMQARQCDLIKQVCEGRLDYDARHK